MALRRWLTSVYDWTGLSGLLYKSLPISLLAFILAFAGVIGFSAYQNFKLESIMHFGHYFEMFAIGTVFTVIILPNIVRMWWLTIYKPELKVPIANYFKAFGELIVHMFTQKRTLGCDDSQTRWFMHLLLVSGYLLLLLITVVFDWFHAENILVIGFGYLLSAIVFTITVVFVSGRIKKKAEVSKHSQSSDWFFVIWLFLLGLSSLLVRLFIDMEIIETNIWMYLFHLTVLVQWALIIVPFGKWTHFIYRSFAMYFDKLKKIS